MVGIQSSQGYMVILSSSFHPLKLTILRSTATVVAALVGVLGYTYELAS